MRRILPFVLSLACLPALWADPCRLYLAEQYDWSGSRGFYLDFENDTSGAATCRLSNLKMYLGVADGQRWRFVSPAIRWETDRDYTVRAVIADGSSELWVDGASAARLSGGYSAQPGDLIASDVPGWAAAPAEYLVAQSSLAATSSGGAGASVSMNLLPAPLMLFNGPAARHLAWSAAPGETQTFTVTFRILAIPDPRAFDPYVDRYGQSRYGDWPGKTHSDDDLAAADNEEIARLAGWGVPDGYDPYGGILADWSGDATGFFHLAQHNGFWWLITPAGNPCFYIGVTTAPGLTWDMTPITGRESIFAELPPATGDYAQGWGANVWSEGGNTRYVAFQTANMIRKYGPDWANVARARLVQRMQSWGFSGLGKWSQSTGALPVIPVLSRGGVPLLVRHPDIFDSAVQAQFRNALARQVAPRAGDPLVVGWSLGNEYDEIVTSQETADMLQKGAEVAAKRALVDQALANLYGGSAAAMAAAWKVTAAGAADLYASKPTPPPADIEALPQFFASSYYAFIYGTVKDLDPNHLYFGFWIVPGWWQNESDWGLIAPYCDAIGYDNYSYQFADDRLARLMRATDKPVLVGEFSFPATYAGARGFRPYRVNAADDTASGMLYSQWLQDAAQNPWCIGVGWFQYRDEPVAGRGPGQGPLLVYGEDFAFGLVDAADRPKYDLVEQVRQANLAAAPARLAAGSQ